MELDDPRMKAQIGFLPEHPYFYDYLTARGRRAVTEITLVMPFGTPIPPSPETSQAILAAFAERGIRFIGDRLVAALDPARKVALLDDGSELPYALFLGVPVHRVPKVVAESGLADENWVAVDKKTLATRFPGVYAIGDSWAPGLNTTIRVVDENDILPELPGFIAAITRNAQNT